MAKDKEYILCAAVMYLNIIVPGRRHGDCYTLLKALNADISISDRSDQGFLTSFNRFVNRKEAWTIALANNQVKYGLEASSQDNPNDNILISENLY